jgi:small redox-active disulfide protein 2
MVNIKVLGPGCANCKWMAQLVQKVAADRGLPIELEKVTEYADIMRWPILSTPGLVVHETLVVSGRIPSQDEIASWLTS